MPAALVSLDDIRAAAGRVRGVAVRTPVLEIDLQAGSTDSRGGRLPPTRAVQVVALQRTAEALAEAGQAAHDHVGPARLALKCENLQPMGAFKIRGACNLIAQLPPDARAAGVITFSSGNHGQALALVARHFGIPAVVVMPHTAPRVKIDGVRRYGAEVILEGTTSLERMARAEAEAAARGLTMVPPFDHPAIIAGQGTVGLEVLEQYPEVTTVIVPAGGGGLLSGVSTAVKQMRSGVRVIGVEPEGAPKLSTSLDAGHPVTLERTASIADGLLPLRPGDVTFAHVRAFVDRVVTVPDEAIAAAVAWLFREARLVAEPSGAVTVAAVLSGRIDVGERPVAVISGGNVAPEDYTKYIVNQA